MKPQLFPRPRKRLHQPRKSLLRSTLADAADTIIALRREVLASHAELDRVYAWLRVAVFLAVACGVLFGLLVQASVGVLP